MRKIILLLITVLNSANTFSQKAEIEKKYTEIELNTDLDYLVTSLCKTHPNPFSIVPKTQFLNEVSRIKSNFKNGLDYREFYKLIAPLIASLSDGHTSIRFPGSKILNDGSSLFPFSATCDFKKKSITINEYMGENSPIPANAELISINNISSEKIIEKIIENTSGENNEYRLRMGSNFSFFGLILKTYYDFNDVFEVKYKTNGKIESKIVEAIRFRDFKDYVNSKKSPKNQVIDDSKDYFLTMRPEIKTAIIEFKYFNDEEKFGVFLKNTFDSINKTGVKNLIIDIRENGGGNSVLGDQLFRYIAKKPFTQFGEITVKISQLQKDYYEQKCIEDSTYCDTYKYISKIRNGKILSIKSEELIAPNSSLNRFDGRVYLLTSLRTFSSASNFAQCFKNYKLGTIVGEETGGWKVCYGDKIITKLPNTQMTFAISTKKFYTIGSTDKDLHGIFPDIEIDAEKSLEFILNKIEKEN